MDHDLVDQIIDRHHAEASALIQVLLEIQAEANWLCTESLKTVSERLEVPLARVLHVATFYKAFSLVPKGRHQVHVCMGTACHVRGAPRVLSAVQDATGIGPGETDLELKFSVETVNCLGCCALGPVIEVNGTTHGKVSTVATAKVLERYE